MSKKPTSPETLYGTGRDYLREQIKTNEILADIAGVEYTPPEGVPKGKYMENKWLLDAAEKKNELLEEIAEGGPGGGSAAAKAIGIDYATDGIFLKNKNGDTIQGSGATLPAYGVTFDPATGGLTLTKNGTAMQGQTVTIPNYGSPVGVDASADMTDHDKIYLYLGTTGGGLTNGHFYYWDGAAWADGGEYAAATVQTDKTLLVEDRAADAKATGDAVNSLKTQLNDISEETSVELTGTKTTGKFINGDAIVATGAAAFYVVEYSVEFGDNLRINGAAANNGYLYIFTNNNGETISYPTKNTSGTLKNYTDVEIIAPENAVHLVISSHSSSSYTQAKAEKITGYRVIGLDELEDEVDNAETNISANDAKTKALKTSVEPLFEYNTKTGTGELIAEFSELSGLNIENASSAIIRSAQIFEPVYSGSVVGITVTKNNDGSYTINGTATSSAGLYLNQSTRTGHDKLVPMNGNYSCSIKVLSGKATPQSGATYGRFVIMDYYDDNVHIIDALSPYLTENNVVIENKSTGGAINAIIGVFVVANCVYDHLTIKISVNKGENVLDTESEYVEPVTITDMSEALNAAKACLPYIWITTTPDTATITAIGKTIKYVEIPDPPAPPDPIDLYSVLVKYNDRVDTLMQLFNRNLFLVYTDIHASLANLQRINTWAENNKSSIYVSDTYCLGDMLHDHPGDDRPITNFDNVAIWPKTLKVIGNHDVGTGSSELTAKQTYDAYIAPYISQWGNVVQPTDAATDGKSYYYKDYNNKIRIIVLDIYHYDSAQSTWFETVLADAITNSLAVIIAQHADICTAAEKEPLNPDYPFARKHNGYTGLQYSLSYTSQRTTVDTFIENGGTFICWLTGHMHADMAGTYTGTHGKQLSIVLANAGMSIDGTYLRFNNYSQDCFTYLGVDTDTNYLYLLRIGESVDKWFHKNLFLCYDYANHAVIEYQ